MALSAPSCICCRQAPWAIIIGLVLLTLPFALVIAFVGSRRRKKRERAEAEAASAAETVGTETTEKAAATTTPTGKYPELEQSIIETIQFLRTSSLGDGGKDALYSLPWYIVAGPPRSGKTSLIVGSDLDFQTLPSQRQSEQKFVRATTSVTWRVTSEAVFIDTSGRYQTEGSDSDSTGIDTQEPPEPPDRRLYYHRRCGSGHQGR